MKDGFKLIGGVLAALLVIGLIGGGVWAIKVAMSPVKGTGDTVVRNNDTYNRTGAQQRFNQLYAAIQTNSANIAVAGRAAKAHPNDRILGTNYDGAIQICITSVNEYNGFVNNTLARDWRPAELPEYVDPAATCRYEESLR